MLLGDMGAGKSSLVLRFVKGQFHDYQVKSGKRGKMEEEEEDASMMAGVLSFLSLCALSFSPCCWNENAILFCVLDGSGSASCC